MKECKQLRDTHLRFVWLDRRDILIVCCAFVQPSTTNEVTLNIEETDTGHVAKPHFKVHCHPP